MIFALLTLLSALTLAGVSGWFSIVGIMSIYAGAPLHAALVMGIVIEFAKLVTTSWLYRNWPHASWWIKGPLVYFTIALMFATSIGVFGFLTKGHLEQGASTIDNSAKVDKIDQQILREQTIIVDNERVIKQLDAAVDAYMGGDNPDRAVAIRKSQNKQRTLLRDEIDKTQARINGYGDEKFVLQSQIRSLQLEVGPIKYIAEIFNGASTDSDSKKIESAVKYFTLLIVSTLDPLAIVLLIAANYTILRLRDEKTNTTPTDQPEVHRNAPTTTLHNTSNSPSSTGPLPTGTTLHDSDTGTPFDNYHAIHDLVYAPGDGNVDGEEITNFSPIAVAIKDDEPETIEITGDSLTTSDEITIQPCEASAFPISEKENDHEIHAPLLTEVSSLDTTINEDETTLASHLEEDATSPIRISSYDGGIPTMYDDVCTTEATAGITEVANEIQIAAKAPPVPWAYQDAILHGLVRESMPHFVPQRLVSDTASVAHEKTVDVLHRGKYPNTLSWLNEFKGD